MSTNSLADRVPYIPAAVAGIGAYLLGYLVTYVSQRGSVEEQLRGFNFIANLFGSEPITVWQAVGWLFYNAHFVRTRIEGGLGGPQSENFIAASDSGSIVLLYLVPMALLLVGGFLLARHSAADDPADGATVGAAVVLGYFPLAVIGAFLFSYEGAIAPDIVTAVLLAGLVYPLVFGATGGAVGTVVGGD
jgi:hypothetical protein